MRRYDFSIGDVEEAAFDAIFWNQDGARILPAQISSTETVLREIFALRMVVVRGDRNELDQSVPLRLDCCGVVSQGLGVHPDFEEREVARRRLAATQRFDAPPAIVRPCRYSLPNESGINLCVSPE